MKCDKILRMNDFEEKIEIPCVHGQLELFCSKPIKSAPLGIMCHPHSLMGGAMQNKIVTTVIKVFHQLGFNTIRFNFRGVGGSTGAFGHGVGEQEDLGTIIAWGKKNYATESIVLGGFSFGAYVALQFCQHFTPERLLLIAPPSHYTGFANLHIPKAPTYLVVAGQDEVVSTPDILLWAEQQPLAGLLNIPEASHFFHGKLIDLRNYFLTVLEPYAKQYESE